MVPVWAAEKLLVFSAASLTDVMSEIGQAYGEKTGIRVTFSFAGSGALARQIEAGAPAHVFVSADKEWMNWATERGAIVPDSVQTFATNQLVVAVRQEVENWADVEELLTTARFAMGEPDTVPAGRYARQALEKMGIWEEAKTQAVFGENVRATLRRLALGEVAAAIVYATDTAAEPDVRTLFTFPADNHDPVVYSAAMVKGSKSEAGAGDFVVWLASADAKTMLKKNGFGIPGATD